MPDWGPPGGEGRRPQQDPCFPLTTLCPKHVRWTRAPPPSAIAPPPCGSGWLAAAVASGDTVPRGLRNYQGVALLRRKVFSESKLGVSSCDRTAATLGCRHSWRERPGPGPAPALVGLAHPKQPGGSSHTT